MTSKERKIAALRKIILEECYHYVGGVLTRQDVIDVLYDCIEVQKTLTLCDDGFSKREAFRNAMMSKDVEHE